MYKVTTQDTTTTTHSPIEAAHLILGAGALYIQPLDKAVEQIMRLPIGNTTRHRDAFFGYIDGRWATVERLS
jgi:hypothetical protein